MKIFLMLLIALMVAISNESLADDSVKEYNFRQDVQEDKPLFPTKWTFVDSDFQNLKLKWKFEKLTFDYDIKSGWLERTDARFIMGIDPYHIPDLNAAIIFTISF